MTMIRNIKAKLKKRSGFTLSEVLVAMIILLLVTSIVAVGIPVAANAYEKLVVASNAELLLSTTMTRLRDELGTARDVTYSGTTIDYTTAGGSKSRIYLGEGEDGIFLKEYVGVSDSSKYDQPIVSKAAANKNLHMTYTIESFVGGVIKFKDLTVHWGEKEVTKLDYFEVRVLSAS